MKAKMIDKKFFFIVAVLVAAGYLIFSSASLGRLVAGSSIYTNLAFKQALYGVVGGGIALFIFMSISYERFRNFALYILIAGIVLNVLVFIPHFSKEYNGAERWLALGPISFQPSELLKFAAVIYYAAWLSANAKRIGTFRYGFLPLAILLAVVEVIFLAQRDTDVVIVAALITMFYVMGGKWRHLLLLFIIAAVGLTALMFYRPYIKDRVLTFINPSRDAEGSSYQLQQGLIAVGTGGFLGRGFGQSIQKFNFLPEAIGDSIFAVEAEEFGLVGSVVLIVLFLLLALRALKIAADAKEPFGALMVVGFVILMIGQSFINIGSILGVLPLTGVPLLFVSQGGTAMLIGLAEVGIILNVSKYRK